MQWLIDGHNLIGHMTNLHLDDPHDEEKLLETLRSYRARTRDIIIVVFDAGLAYQPAKKQKRGGITVQFAPHGQTADKIIIQRLRRIKNPQAVRVVSSDRAVQQVAQHTGVQAVTAQEFANKLHQSLPDADNTDVGSREDVQLSTIEVDAWLNLFKQRKS